MAGRLKDRVLWFAPVIILCGVLGLIIGYGSSGEFDGALFAIGSAVLVAGLTAGVLIIRLAEKYVDGPRFSSRPEPVAIRVEPVSESIVDERSDR